MCVCVYGILRKISFKSVSNKFRTVKSRAGMILKSTLILVNNFSCDSFGNTGQYLLSGVVTSRCSLTDGRNCRGLIRISLLWDFSSKENRINLGKY